MRKHTCTIHTTCDSHAVLHRLSDIAAGLPDQYDGTDLPFHGASPRVGDLFTSRLLPDGTRVSGKISRLTDRTLEATIDSPTHDTADIIVEFVGPLVEAYLSQYAGASDHISQQYAKA